MGGTYCRKTNRQGWSRDVMKKAMKEVKDGVSVNATAKKYSLPEATLRRYVRKYSEDALPTNAGRFKSTFTEEQLNKLKDYVMDLDRRAFGMTREQFGKIAFDYAEALKINHRFNMEKRQAGKDFIQSFRTKFKFSLRKPENTSAARLAAFNENSVKAFYDLYKEVLKTKHFQPNQIYNIDETGCSTVPTKSPSVLSPKGARRVIKISSAERGINVSVACCFSAVGQYVPPFFIFPRVRMQQHFLNNSPPGSSGVCNESGWMNAETFVEWLKHFIANVRPNKDNPILLFMDNHTSHVTLQAVNICRDNHISLLGFPPHTSHRMQPLDVAFYGPFKTAYSRACDDFLMTHPGEIISIKDVAGLFNVAYRKVATIDNAIKGFKATGIVPVNSQIFSDSDFEPSMTTEKPYEAQPVVHEAAEPSAVNTTGVDIAGPSTAKTVSALPPLPEAAPKGKKQKRKKLPSLYITSTPVKQALEDIKAEKELKEKKKEQARRNRIEKQKEKQQKPNKGKKMIHVKKLLQKDSSDSSVEIKYDEQDNDEDFIEEQDNVCIICCDFAAGGTLESWYACSVCHKWVHAACSGYNEEEAMSKAYICDFCL